MVYKITFEFEKIKNTKTIEKVKKRADIKEERYSPIPKKKRKI